jgi:hypothetical protein
MKWSGYIFTLALVIIVLPFDTVIVTEVCPEPGSPTIKTALCIGAVVWDFSEPAGMFFWYQA